MPPIPRATGAVRVSVLTGYVLICVIQAKTPAAGCLDCTRLGPTVPGGAPPPMLRDIILEADGSAQNAGRPSIPHLTRRRFLGRAAALGALVSVACRPPPPAAPAPL